MAVRLALVACALIALAAGPAPAAVAAAGRTGTARALGDQMRHAGGRAGALAVDLDSGRVLYARRAGVPRMPASVEKLYTTATGLRRLGSGARLSTDVLVAARPDAAGVIAGDLYLRGGGDPNFGVVDAGRLAALVRGAGITAVTGRVVGDESAFDARRGVPSSAFRLTGDVGPLSALSYRRGMTGRRAPYWQPRPARAAAAGFARQLRSAGVRVRGRARTGRTAASAVPVTAWRSAPLADLVRQMNQPSDNFMAEMLVKVLGHRFGGAGTTLAGTAVMAAELAELGIAPRMIDGSGLSRSDRTSPRQVLALLQAMVAEPAFTGSLAVAGRSGTLEHRMRGTAAQDRCRGKTGTLHDVSALAGYCTTVRGRTVAFAFLMNGVSPWGARALQDRMVVALARYGG